MVAQNPEIANMKDEEEIFQTNLERCSYRYLQQTAKAMGLPSNVKKVYLIQLINTKNYSSPRVLDQLVRHIREEQKHQALVRSRKAPKKRKKKNEQQSPEISSTSNGPSPPITNTPKRVDHVLIRYSPEAYSPLKYPQTLPSRRLPITSSDRVLRSSNRVAKPSYLLNNTLLTLLEGDSDERAGPKGNVVSTEEDNRKAKRIFAKQIIDSWKNGGQSVPVPRSPNVSPPLGKRQSRLSGIYPLQPEDTKLPSVAVRHADGSISKLKAIIQKPITTQYSDRQTQTDTINRYLLKAATPKSEFLPNTTYRSSVSEIKSSLTYKSSNSGELISNSRPSNMNEITSNIDLRTPSVSEATNSDYRTLVSESPRYSISGNASFLTTQSHYSFNRSSSSEETTLSNTSRENNQDREYYHKKIRAEQVRSSRMSKEIVRTGDSGCQLPKINEVFTKFSSVFSADVMQPLYVQVDNEPEFGPTPPFIPDPRLQYQGSNSLEMLYNLKTTQFLPLQICTTTNTHTVYCTPIITTAKPQPSATAMHNAFNIASPQRDSQPFFMNDEEIPRAPDFFSNFHCHEQNNIGTPTDFQRSCSSVETMASQEQELGANVTIPEMVEDALEIISQDGDYMERMGMDIRMQCILCNWAGPKIILEYHIRKNHSSEIMEWSSTEMCASYTLGALCARRVWLSRVLQRDGELYVLSAKYEDPDCFMAALSSVSYDQDEPKTGSMTIYNKVTGEPFTWTGVIMDLPPCMPYENDPNCFRLQLSKMDLLPNSANLELVNRELVLRSPNKVVVGQPELNSIQISLIAKIFD